MAKEIGPSQIQIGRDGALALSTRFLFDSRRDALRDYPRTFEGLGWAGANGTPFSTKDGKWILAANYEGLLEDPTAEEDTYDMRGEEREVPIENLPDRELLKSDWGAYEEGERLLFRPKLARSNQIGEVLNLDSYNGSSEIDNPLFGATSYPVEYQVAVWRMVRRRVPASILKLPGTVQKSLPAGFDRVDPNKKWYVRPLVTSKRGSLTRIEVQFKEISNFTAIEAIQRILSRGGREEGLTTGSL